MFMEVRDEWTDPVKQDVATLGLVQTSDGRTGAFICHHV